MRYTFSKRERLCSQRSIEALMQKGNPSVRCYPLAFVWKEMPLDAAVPAQVLISVSKRNMKRAVDRNYIKRMLREAYRLHKPEFFSLMNDHQIALQIHYMARTPLPFEEIHRRVHEGLLKIVADLCTP